MIHAKSRAMTIAVLLGLLLVPDAMTKETGTIHAIIESNDTFIKFQMMHVLKKKTSKTFIQIKLEFKYNIQVKPTFLDLVHCKNAFLKLKIKITGLLRFTRKYYSILSTSIFQI